MPAVKAAPARKRSNRRDSDSTQLVLPAFRPFQLATLEKRVPEGDGWIYEIKYDGYRCQAAIAGSHVRLYSRNGHDWTEQFGYVAPALSRLTPGTALIDGEICALDGKGRSNFSKLKLSLDGKKPLYFFAFDLLEQNGENIAARPQIERKRRLEAMLSGQPPESPVVYSQHVQGDGKGVFDKLCKGGFEGLIAKSATARYYGGERSTAWYKIKCVNRQELVVIGWRAPEYGVDNVRALFLATWEDGGLVYRGAVGTGFTDRLRTEIWDVLQLIRRDEALEVAGVPKVERRFIRWVEPRLLAEVEYTELTPDGTLRHPSYKGLRIDKDAREVVLEETPDA